MRTYFEIKGSVYFSITELYNLLCIYYMHIYVLEFRLYIIYSYMYNYII